MVKKSDKARFSKGYTPTRKPKTARISKPNKHKWKENEIIDLIAAIEKRPQLWAADADGRQKNRKLVKEHWKDLISELNIEDIGWIEVRKKWSDLKKNCSPHTKWAKYMLFLDSAKKSDASSPLLKGEVNSAGKRSSMQNSPISIACPSTSSLDPNIDVNQPSKRRCIESLLTSSKVSSSTPCVSSVPTTSQAAIPIPDPNSTFCSHLLAELSLLSDLESRNLRRLLIQVAYDFGDYIENQPTAV